MWHLSFLPQWVSVTVDAQTKDMSESAPTSLYSRIQSSVSIITQFKGHLLRVNAVFNKKKPFLLFFFIQHHKQLP